MAFIRHLALLGNEVYMFGYVTINKPEMKFKEYNLYRSYYCGLCKAMGKRHGNLCRLSLSYVVNFLVMLLTSLYEPESYVTKEKCIIHPFNKQNIRSNEFTDYGADVNLMLAYSKFEDDWNDEKKLKAKILMALLKGKNSKTIKSYEEKMQVITDNLRKLSEYEKANETNIDYVAGAFGNILSEIYVYKKDEWEADLRRMGFYLGKFIYIMDAYEDIEEDIKKGNYNPLKNIFYEEDFENKCYNKLTMMMAECTKSFERLPIVENVQILRNILYAGVWVKYTQISRDRLESSKNGGQHD